MRIKRTAAVFCMCIGYGLVSLFSAYTMIQKHETKRKSDLHSADLPNFQQKENSQADNITIPKLEIIDTSGIGMYLWKHILMADLPDYPNEGWYQSRLTTSKFNLRYNLGNGLTPSQLLEEPSGNVMLALNGRDKSVSSHAELWLDYILKMPHLKNLGLLLLGDESCHNTMLKKYRNFPSVKSETLDIEKERSYICNFIGTVYANSSRETLKSETGFMKNGSKCIFKYRESWLTEESAKSSVTYQHALLNSDLTLSPVGKNSECYRTYEALEYGSIPVIENQVQPNSCEGTKLAPYSLLKQHSAPVLYVQNWKQLKSVIDTFSTFTLKEKIEKRRTLMKWYQDFKLAMKNSFLQNMYNLFRHKS
uniref:ribitol-5-phosphate xylosyltransferase 1 isoform X2 n=1 Tax=Ciona intestinalis TaxID=7719 RepID=UPI000EF4D038|nr:ribitol-5-phosphate xylosyltransferase 1 isoform X2 [Ciona intestinalis]|eukprot:XP_026691377.1 ribitol-5-phosphate xylosyltransferase 1 isoform X2 [Ciona intestinalis]